MSKFLSLFTTKPGSEDVEGSGVPHEFVPTYQLPSTVESIRNGWLLMTGNSSTVSSLLAVVAALLVSFFKDNKNFTYPQSGAQEATLILTYVAIILSISATISALCLTDEFAEIPGRAARETFHTAHPATNFAGDNWDIIRYFGARKSTRWIIYHWVATLLLATLCVIASIVLYAATQGTRTCIIISVISGLATLPPLCHFFVPL